MEILDETYDFSKNAPLRVSKYDVLLDGKPRRIAPADFGFSDVPALKGGLQAWWQGRKHPSLWQAAPDEE